MKSPDFIKKKVETIPSSLDDIDFCHQVSNLASEAKKERNVLTKEVTKISNYGISI